MAAAHPNDILASGSDIRPKNARHTWAIRCRAFDLGRKAGALPRRAFKPWDGIARWTEWEGGASTGSCGERLEAALGEFAARLRAYSKLVVPKRTGRQLTGGLSRDGSHKDSACEALTLYHGDSDAGLPWGALAAVLRAAGAAHVLQKSSSSRPDCPRWHLWLPVAAPLAPPEKDEWMAQYAHVTGFLEGVARMPGPRAGGPHGQGLDPTTDALLNLSFAPARGSPEDAPPALVWREGLALDWRGLLRLTAYDREFNARVLAGEQARSRRADRLGDARRMEPEGGPEKPPRVRAFEQDGWLRGWERDAWRAWCPWHEEHAGGHGGGEWDARVYHDGRWWCPHSTCAGRAGDVLGRLSDEARRLVERHEETAGFARTRAALEAAPVPAHELPAAEVAACIRRELDAALATADAALAAGGPAALRGLDVLVLAPAPGSGKTAAVIADARANQERPISYVSLSNDLAEQVRDDYVAPRDDKLPPRAAVRRFGILSVRRQDGSYECRRSGAALELQAAGISPARILCVRCPHAPTRGGGCRAFGGIETSAEAAEARTLITNQGLLQLAIQALAPIDGLAPLLEIDEPPAPVQHQKLDREDVSAAVAVLEESAVAAEPLVPREIGLASIPLLRLVLSAIDRLGERKTGEAPAAALAAAAPKLAADARWVVKLRAGRKAAGLLPRSAPAADGGACVAMAVEPFASVPREEPLSPVAAAALARGRGAGFAAARAAVRAVGVLNRLAAWLAPPAGLPAAVARWEPRLRALVVTSPHEELRIALDAPAAVVVLDATPNVRGLEALAAVSMRKLRVVSLDVRDGATVRRVLTYASRASRGAMCPWVGPRRRVRWRVVGPLVVAALARLRRAERDGFPAQTVLLASHMPVAEALARATGGELDAIRHPGARAAVARWLAEGRALDVRHFGALRGLNDFAGHDGCVTLGDPRPNVCDALDAGELLGLGREASGESVDEVAAAELSQIHGRLRAPWRRRPALMLHFGQVVPLGWHRENTKLERLAAGRPRGESVLPAELRALIECSGLSARGFSEERGVPYSTLASWLKGGVPPDAAMRLRAAGATPAAGARGRVKQGVDVECASTTSPVSLDAHSTSTRTSGGTGGGEASPATGAGVNAEVASIETTATSAFTPTPSFPRAPAAGVGRSQRRRIQRPLRRPTGHALRGCSAVRIAAAME